MHGWYETDQGIRVRKPLGAIDNSYDAGIGVSGARDLSASRHGETGVDESRGGSNPRPAQKSWWQKLWVWIKKLWN